MECSGYSVSAITCCLEFLEPYDSDDYFLLMENEFVKETLFLHEQDKFEFDYHEHVMPIQGMCKEDYGNYSTN